MKYLPFLAVGLFTTSVAFGQQSNEAALSGLIRQSFDYYPKLKEQQQAISLGQTKTKIAEAARLPTVGSDASYQYVWPLQQVQFSLPGVGDRSIQFMPRNNYNVGISASQTVYDFGKDAAQIDKTKTETLLSVENLETAKHQLAYQVAQLYFGVVYLQKAIRVQRSQESLINATAKVIEDRIKSGDEIDYNLVATRVRYKNVATRIVDLQNQLDRQFIALGSLVGKDVHPDVDTTASFDWKALSLTEDPQTLAQSNNPDLRLARMREQVAEKDIEVAKASKMPSLSLNGAAGFKNGIQPEIEQFRFNGGVGVKISAPIYAGKRYQLQEELARKNLQMNQYSTENAKLGVRTQISQALSELQSVTEKLKLSDTQLQEARYALKLADVRFQNGVITQLEIQSAQTAVEEAEFQQIQFLYQQALARLELNRLAGTKIW
ncbi:TolC family protein [Siphonobacter aquaeclarae]|jgi:outer membrane protein|uniref:Outer membrane protein TolC n=1 Tax=Siphonobacter aquaeclarae TaxID=563176 RepID=A0A1G9UHJ7_9BACT|nr:TolC family protein [Siphonobacter aquaeclarae]SDM59025.1 Outer membrane protein TolC [Siphonobacter aquaeclarae]